MRGTEPRTGMRGTEPRTGDIPGVPTRVYTRVYLPGYTPPSRIHPAVHPSVLAVCTSPTRLSGVLGGSPGLKEAKSHG